MTNDLLEQPVDLHVHTTASDGDIPPEDIPVEAARKGLRAVAITDHDSLAGIRPAQARARGTGVEVVPGVELTAYSGLSEVHILGLCLQRLDGFAADEIIEMGSYRLERAKEIVGRLCSLGADIAIEDVMKIAGEGVVGRPHIARALVERGAVGTFAEAFRKYIGEGKPAYVPKRMLTPEDAVKLVRSLGGAPVFAHPGVTRHDELIPSLVGAGLVGIEVHHPMHSVVDVEYYTRMAKKHGLVVTGGSDYHGLGVHGYELGSATVPYSALEELRLRASSEEHNRLQAHARGSDAGAASAVTPAEQARSG